MRFHSNERSVQLDVIGKIKSVVHNYDLAIKDGNGEKTVFSNQNSVQSKGHMFPDVMLFADANQTEILQGWELKMPDVDVTDKEFIEDAQNKARTLGLNSTVLWNFNIVQLYILNDDDKWELYKVWNDLNHIKTRQDTDYYKNDWLNFIEKFLLEINEFILNGQIIQKNLVEITDNIVQFIINDYKFIVANHLEGLSKKNRRISSEINIWWLNAKVEFLGDENNPLVAYSKVILLGWILRISFSHVIKEYHNQAKEINNINIDSTPEEVNDLFEAITKVSDFYTIFENKKYDTYIPDTAWKALISFSKFLENKIISHGVLQDILETTVNRSKRELIGQFTTPINLAKLLVRVTMLNTSDHAIDPCTGTGTIAKEILNLKNESGQNLNHSHETTWASDKLQFALQISNMALTSPDSMNMLNKVFQKNVFDLSTDQNIEFTSPVNGEVINESLPKFSTIVSNLPFIAFELSDKDEKDKIQSIVKEIKSKYSLKIDGRSDYYVYILYALSNLVDIDGRVGIITSNSWLGTKWGKGFYKLLLELFDIDSIITSGQGRWFHNADVVTSIIVLNKKKKGLPINFVEIKANIHDLNDEEIKSLSDSIIIGDTNDIISTVQFSSSEIEDFFEHGISLRALTYELDWFNNVKSLLSPLTNYFSVHRGERRGWNRLFHLESDHKVEQVNTTPYLKSSKSIQSLITKLDGTMLTVTDNLEELKSKGHTNTLSWIKKFENATNGAGEPLTSVLSSKNQEWYQFKNSSLIAEFVTSVNPDKRLFWAMLEEPALFNQRLIGITRNHNGKHFDKRIFLAILNSLLGVFFIEAAGFGRGLGALDLNKGTIEKIYILNPDLLTKEQQSNIIDMFYELDFSLSAPTLSSISSPERESFDKYLLRCFGIEHEYNNIKDSLEKLITTRTSVRK